MCMVTLSFCISPVIDLDMLFLTKKSHSKKSLVHCSEYCSTQELQVGNLQFTLRSEGLHWQEEKLKRLSPTGLSVSSLQKTLHRQG